jgi:hypothetical protein
MASAPAPSSLPPHARSEVPLALWPCAQPDRPDASEPAPPRAPDGRALLPTQLVRRLLCEYTRPGALLVGPACLALLGEAARAGRCAVALTPDPARAGHLRTLLDATVPADRRPLAQIRTASPTHPEVIGDLAGQAHALITVNLDGHAHPAATAEPASLAARAALLRPGGLLITISRNQQHQGRLVDLAAQTIRAAEQAGLAYLQHVIALLAPVQAGQLWPRVTGWQRRTVRARLARGECAQLAVHADVLVFATPEAADA